jgi:hypothetical protein
MMTVSDSLFLQILLTRRAFQSNDPVTCELGRRTSAVFRLLVEEAVNDSEMLAAVWLMKLLVDVNVFTGDDGAGRLLAPAGAMGRGVDGSLPPRWEYRDA